MSCWCLYAPHSPPIPQQASRRRLVLNRPDGDSDSEAYSDVEEEALLQAVNRLQDITDVLTDLRGRTKHADKKRAAERAAAEADAAAAASGCCGGYCHRRAANSSIKKFILGVGVVPADADHAVDTLTVVSALLLTVPFLVLVFTDFKYWAVLNDSLATCTEFPHGDTAASTAEKMFLSVYRGLNTTIYGRYGTGTCSVPYVCECVHVHVRVRVRVRVCALSVGMCVCVSVSVSVCVSVSV